MVDNAFLTAVITFGIVFFMLLIVGVYLQNKENQKINRDIKDLRSFDDVLDAGLHGVRKSYYFAPVAGITYRNTHEDIGGFIGFIKHEPENEKDKNAIAIYRIVGGERGIKRIGYIPKNKTADLRAWCARPLLPCVGYIDSGGVLFGRIKVLHASREEVWEQIARFVRYLVAEFGVEFVPKDFEIIGAGDKLETGEAWIKAINESLAESEEEHYGYMADTCIEYENK